MTDTTSTLPVADDFASIPAKGMTRTASWLFRAGAGFGAFLVDYSRAIDMAYSDPFRKPPSRQTPDLREDQAGRDPNW